MRRNMKYPIQSYDSVISKYSKFHNTDKGNQYLYDYTFILNIPSHYIMLKVGWSSQWIFYKNFKFVWTLSQQENDTRWLKWYKMNHL